MQNVRERIVRAAYPLFVNRGIRDVTLDEIQRQAEVTAAQFTREFASRDDVAAVCLQRREVLWTVGVVEDGARSRGTTPEEHLLAIFDVFNDWFHRDDYEACTFVNVLLEMGREHPLGRASCEYLEHIRQLIASLAVEANLDRVDEFTLSCHILMKGAIINAAEGDTEAALRAKDMAGDLVAQHRLAPTAVTVSHPRGTTVAVVSATGQDDADVAYYLDFDLA